jgi:hypothetical protein
MIKPSARWTRCLPHTAAERNRDPPQASDKDEHACINHAAVSHPSHRSHHASKQRARPSQTMYPCCGFPNVFPNA